MRPTLLIFLALLPLLSLGAPKTIHVFVALCDNVNQGIVPVPGQLGNGQVARTNLYWGAAFGVKSFFKYKTSEWKLIKTIAQKNPDILERILFICWLMPMTG